MGGWVSSCGTSVATNKDGGRSRPKVSRDRRTSPSESLKPAPEPEQRAADAEKWVNSVKGGGKALACGAAEGAGQTV